MPFSYMIPYGSNILKNPSANDGVNNWDDVTNVTVVDGGVDDYDSTPNTFKFGPTASMKQTAAVPGFPPDLELQGYFLPGRDVSSATKVKTQIVFTLRYADGSAGRYVIPGKTFIW